MRSPSPVEGISQAGAAVNSGARYLGHAVVQIRSTALVRRIVVESAVRNVIVVTIVLQNGPPQALSSFRNIWTLTTAEHKLLMK